MDSTENIKEVIDKILAESSANLSYMAKGILIYLLDKQDINIPYSRLSKSLGGSNNQAINAVKQLQEKGQLVVNKEGRFGNKYQVTFSPTQEKPIKDKIDTLCLECGESVGEDAVESIQGVFCDNYCFGKHVL